MTRSIGKVLFVTKIFSSKNLYKKLLGKQSNSNFLFRGLVCGFSEEEVVYTVESRILKIAIKLLSTNVTLFMTESKSFQFPEKCWLRNGSLGIDEVRDHYDQLTGR